MKQDPGIDWIRAVRSTISHEVHNNPKELIAFHRSLRGKYGRESQHERIDVTVSGHDLSSGTNRSS